MLCLELCLTDNSTLLINWLFHTEYEEFLDTLTNRKEDRSKAKIQRERFRVTMDEIDKEVGGATIFFYIHSIFSLVSKLILLLLICSY